MSDLKTELGAIDTRKAVGRMLLCVVDDTDELSVALQFAARRARRTEAQAEAERVLARAADHVMRWCDTPPVFYIREGDRRDEVIEQINEDPSIAFLILGAATGRDGPGPLVTALTGKWVGQLHIPVVIVPGNVSEDEIESCA